MKVLNWTVCIHLLVVCGCASPQQEPEVDSPDPGRDSEEVLALMEQELLLPVMYIYTQTGGSAVIVHKRPLGEVVEVFALTCNHIINKDGGLGYIPHGLVPYQGRKISVECKVLCSDEDLDIALLRFVTSADVAVAQPASPEEWEKVRVFTKVWVIGYPIRKGPIPTGGEITCLSIKRKGKEYAMTSAPAFYGNSGGGVFTAETRKFLGVLAFVHSDEVGDNIDVLVPHMNYFIPVHVLRRWLVEDEYGFVLGG